MKSHLKSRIANLEAKAASVMSHHVVEDVATVAANIEALRAAFAAHLAAGERRAALPLAEQLLLAQEELEDLLADQAEQRALAVANDTSVDEFWMRLKEKFQRSWIQKLEADVLLPSVAANSANPLIKMKTLI